MRRSARSFGALLSWACVLAPVDTQPSQAGAGATTEESPAVDRPTDRPNVLILCTDQHSRLALGCVDGLPVRTPNLDELAAEGVLFRSAYCNTPLCSPSRHSFLSGRYSTETGVIRNTYEPFDDVTFLPSYLDEAGYRSFAIGKMHFNPVDAMHGFETIDRHEAFLDRVHSVFYPWLLEQLEERGLEEWDWRTSGNVRHGDWLVDNPYPDDLTPDAWIARRTLERIEDSLEAGEPFFAFTSFVTPHHPYAPVQKYLDMYANVEIELPASWHRVDEAFAQRRERGEEIRNIFADMDEEDFQKVLRYYLAFVTQVDHHIGTILDGLDELGVRENTLVMMISDHGDLAGEHRAFGKGGGSEGSTGIPFILRWPARLSAERTFDEPVSLIDIVPTVLTAAGLPVPPEAHGQDLLPVVLGEAEPNPVYIVDARERNRPLVAVVSGGWKIIYHRQGAPTADTDERSYRLHDLSEDPDEIRPIPGGRVPQFGKLRAELEAFWRQQQPFVERNPQCSSPSRGGAANRRADEDD